MAGNIPCWIKLNRVSSRTFGIISEKIPDYALPERQGDTTIIPGSNQPVFIDGGGYKPVDRTYNLTIIFDSYLAEEFTVMPTPGERLDGKIARYMGATTPSYEHGKYYRCSENIMEVWVWAEYDPIDTVQKAARQFANWLYRYDGYLDLEDEYDAGYVVKARIKTPGTVTSINDQAATLQVTFECAAEKFLNDNSVISSTTIWMDTPTTTHYIHRLDPSPIGNNKLSSPTITITIGSGFHGDSFKVFIRDGSGDTQSYHMVLDFTDVVIPAGFTTSFTLDCQRHILLDSGGNNASSRMTMGNLGWPKLNPLTGGKISIHKESGHTSDIPIRKTEVNPRWWTI